MLDFFTTLIIVSLLIPSGFNFFIEKAVDYSYAQPVQINAGPGPKRIVNKSFGLKTTARSILVLDDKSGTILYQKQAKQTVPIASITKLMTALVFLETNPDWRQIVEILPDDKKDGGLIQLLPGEQVSLNDLFNIMLVGSSNEAAYALARSSGIQDFVAAMNQKAAELGMIDTYFVEPSGLAPTNISSASDLVKLANAAFSRPEIQKSLLSQEYSFAVVNNERRGKSVNTDQLLGSFLNQGEYQILGAKTGYLEEAGYCLLIKVKKTEGPVLTLAILGAETMTDRWQETKGLVDWLEHNYEWPN